MADNVAITAGSGTSVATDQVGSDHYQKVKLVDATADSSTGVAVDVGTKANALRVAPANNITDGTYIGDIKFGESLPAGTAAIGKLSANSGVDIGDVDVTSVSGTVTVDGSGVTQPVSGTITANLSATDNAVLDSIDTATTATQAAVEGTLSVDLGANNDVTVTSGDITETNSTAILADTASMDTNLGTVAGAVTGTEMQVDVVAALPAGTNAIGKLAANSGVDIGDVTLTAGTNAIGTLLPPDVDVTAHSNYARKYYTSAGAATDGIIWSPAAGKRWHVVTMYINVSAAATVTLEDDKAGGDDAVWKGELAANSGVVLSFTEQYPMSSGEDAADLTITTSAGNVYVTCIGYEV